MFLSKWMIVVLVSLSGARTSQPKLLFATNLRQKVAPQLLLTSSLPEWIGPNKSNLLSTTKMVSQKVTKVPPAENASNPFAGETWVIA